MPQWLRQGAHYTDGKNKSQRYFQIKIIHWHKAASFRRRPGSRQLKKPRVAGQRHQCGFVRYAELFGWLDSGLRRNDGLLDCSGLIAHLAFALLKTAGTSPDTGLPFY
ncbi:MAG: hypothetical protein WA056_05085 [Gallionella sp.]